MRRPFVACSLILIAACSSSDETGTVTGGPPGTGAAAASTSSAAGGGLGGSGGNGGNGGTGGAIGAGGASGGAGAAGGGGGMAAGGMSAGGTGGDGSGGFGGAGGAASSSTVATTTAVSSSSSSSGGGGTVTSTPCQSGAGSTLWRVSWPSNGGGYATVDAWDNGCSYSLADQACRLSGEPHDDANWGPGVVLNSSTDYFRVRFSVQGLSFSKATLYLSVHADGSGIPNAVLESPIHGALSVAPAVPISQHQTLAVDWSSFLSPSDPPSLTAVTLESQPVGLAISFMELCAE